MTPSATTAGEDPLAHLPASIPEALALRATRADDPFIIGPAARLTFAEADRASLDLASRLLAAGVGKGSRVGLLFANTPAWVVTWLAATRLGALTVPLSTFAPGPELARTLRSADVHAVLLAPRFDTTDLAERFEAGLPGLAGSGPSIVLPDVPFLRWVHVDGGGPSWSTGLDAAVPEDIVLAAQAEVFPSDDLVLISTSGTTAAPKMVLHTHGSLVRHAALLAQRRGLTHQDRIYSPNPFFWVGGLTMVVLAALTSGVAAVVQERFEPGEALALIERERVTQVSCWPNAARALADHPSYASRDLGAVRGGTLIEALPPTHRPSAPDLAPNVLGMSETGGPHTGADDAYLPLPEHIRGTFGRSLPGMEHRIVDPDTGQPALDGVEGELVVRGAFLMEGLYKRERRDTFDPDGWYSTGDLGWFDEHDQLHFTGRRTPMIKSGGSNVSPAEVEAALCDVPGVRAAYVFAVPAGDRGEDVAAVIVVDPNGAPSADELVAAARERLSSYKVPRHMQRVVEADVPLSPTGKVDMARVRERFVSERPEHRRAGEDRQALS